MDTKDLYRLASNSTLLEVESASSFYNVPYTPSLMNSTDEYAQFKDLLPKNKTVTKYTNTSPYSSPESFTFNNTTIPILEVDYLPYGVLGMTMPGYWIKVLRGLEPATKRGVKKHEIGHNVNPNAPEFANREWTVEELVKEGDLEAADAMQPFIVPAFY